MNFILRRITSENRESNEIIGKSYDFIYDDRKILPNNEFDPEDKTVMSKSYFNLLKGYPEDTHQKVHAFIITDTGNNDKLEHRVIPIYCKSKYYIMTDTGKTFSTIKAID